MARVPAPSRVLAAALLLAAASAAACGRQAPPPRPVQAGSLLLTLRTDPQPPLSRRPVRFRLEVSEQGRPAAAGRAALVLRMPDMDHGDLHVPLRPVGPGRYEGTGVLLMPGRWEATVQVERGAGTVQAVVPLHAPR